MAKCISATKFFLETTDEMSQTDFSTPIIARKKGQSNVFAGHPPTFAQRVVARMTLLLL